MSVWLYQIHHYFYTGQYNPDSDSSQVLPTAIWLFVHKAESWYSDIKRFLFPCLALGLMLLEVCCVVSPMPFYSRFLHIVSLQFLHMIEHIARIIHPIQLQTSTTFRSQGTGFCRSLCGSVGACRVLQITMSKKVICILDDKPRLK